ncbi:hypothetical protein E2320_018804, partial [Naja naja]
TFIYSFLQRGRPFPLKIVFFSALFCIYNGFLQGYYMVYCAEYPDDWCKDIRFWSGLLLFLSGMGINIHSDFLLRQLRKPGEFTYKIPQGGLFAYVSGANFFGEILEWFGYAIATWSLPALAFAFFTVTCVGPRAYHHHRYFYAIQNMVSDNILVNNIAQKQGIIYMSFSVSSWNRSMSFCSSEKGYRTLN